MNWDDLKVLLALSREGSTRKAASKMGREQYDRHAAFGVARGAHRGQAV